MFYIYVIRSETTGKIYIGQTNNLEVRLKRHNGELVSKARSYTRINKGRWVVIYKEEFDNRQGAVNRERYLKSHIGRDWLKTIFGPVAQR